MHSSVCSFVAPSDLLLNQTQRKSLREAGFYISINCKAGGAVHLLFISLFICDVTSVIQKVVRVHLRIFLHLYFFFFNLTHRLKKLHHAVLCSGSRHIFMRDWTELSSSQCCTSSMHCDVCPSELLPAARSLRSLGSAH